MVAPSVLQLRCSCNNYPWGKKGTSSLAARYCAETPGTGFEIDEDKEYAEMWMGTYPELPSYVLETGEDLQEVLNRNKEQLIGESTLKKFGTDLPFLPKVLSIEKALPLQTHPNKSLAAKLHEKDPSQFTDPNHKPEIAVALSKFEAFCGWKPLDRIEPLFRLAPLQRYVPSGKAFDDATLKEVVYGILTDEDDNIARVQEELKALPKEAFGEHTYIPEMLPRLQGQFDKTDPGTLVALLTMNYMVLSPGESIYIPADGIHAYLSGDIIECMARSNNVLNTGFCPRAERNSAKTFIETLTFAPHSPDDARLSATPFSRSSNGKTFVYAPPMSEFDMLLTKVEAAGESDTVQAVGGPSVMIVTSGNGLMRAKGEEYELKAGWIFFIGAETEVEFSASGEGGLEVYRAYCE